MRLVSILLILSFVSLSFLAFGQVEEKTQTINSSKIKGYYTQIGYKSLDTEEFCMQVLKEISKPRKKRDFYELEDLKLGNVYYPEVKAYSRFIEKDSVISIWIGIDEQSISSDEDTDLTSLLNEELNAYFETFEDKYFIFAMNRKIEDAEQAVAFTEKGINRLQQVNKGLEEKLIYKQNELERYKNLVEKTQLEVYSVEQEIERNLTNIQESEVDLIRMKKLIEDYKSKIN